ncbi:TerD family protein [bacterium]|nr:TerD family protein [bacterium]
MLSSIALRRLHLLTLAAAQADSKSKLTFLSELASLGYLIENPEDYNDSLLYDYADTVKHLREMRGGNVDYVPLFQGFPDKVPPDNEYFVHRMIGFLVNHCLEYPKGRRLANDMVVPEWLFELEQFGADPISQMQDPKLFEAGVGRQKQRQGDSHVEWVTLRLAEYAEVEEKALQFLRANLYAKSSIQETLRPDLEWLLGHFSSNSIEPSRVVFRETRTYLMKYYWQRELWEEVSALADTPTDFLRLFAAVQGGDVSLAEKIKFPKLKRCQRRVILAGLERASNLEEDLKRYRGLWLAVARGLHPGQLAERYPKTAAAFQKLRNGQIRTFNSKIEMAFQSRSSLSILSLLKERPGTLARRLQQLLLANPDDYEVILTEFAGVAEQVPVKNLLILHSYFKHQGESPYRVIINKSGKIRICERPPELLRPGIVERLLEVVQQAALAQIGKKGSWAGRKCWIDHRLWNYTVPLQQRKASEGMLNLGRGTRIPLDKGKVLRLFVYWKEHTGTTDLDLSLIQFDDNLNYTGHVSYTRLQGEGIVHSGDLQSAPHGAAEFIDMDLNTLLSVKDCRYVAPQIYRYRGDYFGNMECHSGWMIRDRVDCNYQSFDIKTVQNKFDLTGNGSYCLPIIVDLWEGEIIYVDLYVSSVDQHNRVEGAVKDISIVTGEMVRMGKMQPNLYELADWHLRARGATAVKERELADLTFGLTGCDFSADRVEQVLAELL